MKFKLLGLDQKHGVESRAKVFSHRNKIKNMKEQSILLIQGLVYQRSKLEELGKIPSFAKQNKAKYAKQQQGERLRCYI